MSLTGLFGGSFDPIHHGHLIVARAVMEALELDELRFVPVNVQPLKTGRHEADPTARAEMIELAIAGEPRFTLERVELDRPGPSYTVDTLRILRAREPHLEFIVLLGADAAAELPRWREPDELLRLARIGVFARPGCARLDGPPAWRSAPVPSIEISATQVRERVRAGRSIRYLVPAAVDDYIARHRLYLGHV